MVWYSHLSKNFPQFVVIYTVRDFGVINKAKVGVFLVFFCFFNDPTDVSSLIQLGLLLVIGTANIIKIGPCI